jgi:hypothetical protein
MDAKTASNTYGDTGLFVSLFDIATGAKVRLMQYHSNNLNRIMK